METYTEKIAKNLNALIEKNRDAKKGFTNAAQHAKAKSLSLWFGNRALEREVFNKMLKMEVSSFGQDFDLNGSLTGDIHRTWMDFKSLFTMDNDKAMIAEAIRGERAALEEYNSVLAEISLPTSTEGVLNDQRIKIEHGLAILRTLDDIEFQEES
ncbi:PA2169 family four-helix-bundle protein [Zobellia galactanivorans]|uniref:ferritin-like domain-containing protein n=1 Tax=Zobellia galactanivorans (strain DSM 12802 / CCUG 47099 / CIP 106680 / NCIMB 13871 / Dsij) TaxID=63186 RepID=UPI0026E2E9C0|nr:PA2169 family four-helix-bundle protein [Zobellia galactanivorans]MDO6810949.1 PA2169 family four-helix-bundle protein [Zobellia galactanivorans]